MLTSRTYLATTRLLFYTRCDLMSITTYLIIRFCACSHMWSIPRNCGLSAASFAICPQLAPKGLHFSLHVLITMVSYKPVFYNPNMCSSVCNDLCSCRAHPTTVNLARHDVMGITSTAANSYGFVVCIYVCLRLALSCNIRSDTKHLFGFRHQAICLILNRIDG